MQTRMKEIITQVEARNVFAKEHLEYLKSNPDPKQLEYVKNNIDGATPEHNRNATLDNYKGTLSSQQRNLIPRYFFTNRFSLLKDLLINVPHELGDIAIALAGEWEEKKFDDKYGTLSKLLDANDPETMSYKEKIKAFFDLEEKSFLLKFLSFDELIEYLRSNSDKRLSKNIEALYPSQDYVQILNCLKYERHLQAEIIRKHPKDLGLIDLIKNYQYNQNDDNQLGSEAAVTNIIKDDPVTVLAFDKLKVIAQAKYILLDKTKSTEEKTTDYKNHLIANKERLSKHRDTPFMTFIKGLGVLASIFVGLSGVVYKNLFSNKNTHGGQFYRQAVTKQDEEIARARVKNKTA